MPKRGWCILNDSVLSSLQLRGVKYVRASGIFVVLYKMYVGNKNVTCHLYLYNLFMKQVLKKTVLPSMGLNDKEYE